MFLWLRHSFEPALRCLGQCHCSVVIACWPLLQAASHHTFCVPLFPLGLPHSSIAIAGWACAAGQGTLRASEFEGLPWITRGVPPAPMADVLRCHDWAYVRRVASECAAIEARVTLRFCSVLHVSAADCLPAHPIMPQLPPPGTLMPACTVAHLIYCLAPYRTHPKQLGGWTATLSSATHHSWLRFKQLAHVSMQWTWSWGARCGLQLHANRFKLATQHAGRAEGLGTAFMHASK